MRCVRTLEQQGVTDRPTSFLSFAPGPTSPRHKGVDLHPSSVLFARRRPPRCVVFAELVVTAKPCVALAVP